MAFIDNMRMFMSIIFEVFTNDGAINLANYWGSYSVISVLSVTLIILWCYFMVVLCKESLETVSQATHRWKA